MFPSMPKKGTLESAKKAYSSFSLTLHTTKEVPTLQWGTMPKQLLVAKQWPSKRWIRSSELTPTLCTVYISHNNNQARLAHIGWTKILCAETKTKSLKVIQGLSQVYLENQKDGFSDLSKKGLVQRCECTIHHPHSQQHVCLPASLCSKDRCIFAASASLS